MHRVSSFFDCSFFKKNKYFGITGKNQKNARNIYIKRNQRGQTPGQGGPTFVHPVASPEPLAYKYCKTLRNLYRVFFSSPPLCEPRWSHLQPYSSTLSEGEIIDIFINMDPRCSRENVWVVHPIYYGFIIVAMMLSILYYSIQWSHYLLYMIVIHLIYFSGDVVYMINYSFMFSLWVMHLPELYMHISFWLFVFPWPV